MKNNLFKSVVIGALVLLALLSFQSANAQAYDDKYYGLTKSQGDVEVYQSTKMALITSHITIDEAKYEPYSELKIVIHGDWVMYYMKGYDQPMAYRMYFSSMDNGSVYKDYLGRQVIERDMNNIVDGGSYKLYIVKRAKDYVFVMQYSSTRAEALIFKKL